MVSMTNRNMIEITTGKQEMNIEDTESREKNLASYLRKIRTIKEFRTVQRYISERE